LQLAVKTGDSNFDGCSIPVLRLGNKDRSSNASRTHLEPHSTCGHDPEAPDSASWSP
jgi:hypothetical protein